MQNIDMKIIYADETPVRSADENLTNQAVATIQEEIDYNKPVNIAVREASVELRINQLIVKKLENANYNKIPSDLVEEKEFNSSIYNPLICYKTKNRGLEPIQEEIEEYKPNSQPKILTDGLLSIKNCGTDKHRYSSVSHEKFQKVRSNAKAVEKYKDNMQKFENIYTRAKQRLAFLKASSTKAFSFSKLFEEDGEEKVSERPVLVYPDFQLDTASLIKFEEDKIIQLESKKKSGESLDHDIRALREELCLFKIHKSQV